MFRFGHFRLISCFALACIALTSAAPGLSAQERLQPSRLTELSTGDATRGWEAVGRLDVGRGSFCTGALIGIDLVLTAAHCLYDSHTSERIPVEKMEFLAGWRNGRAEAYRSVRRAVPHPDYRYDAPAHVARVAEDLALLQLDRPIRSSHVVPFETDLDLDKGDQVGVVSYAEDRAEAPSLQQVCHVLERFGGVVMVSCSVDFGSSGAPIFSFVDGQARIVSVVSSKAEAQGEPVALAGELRPSLKRLQAALQAEPDKILNRGSALSSGSAANGGGLGAKFVRP